MSQHRGWKTFFTLWGGQTLSVLGSGLTGFALAIWVYQTTGSVTRLALVSFFLSLPGLLLAPVAGVLADRWDRRKIMILSDSLAFAGTLALIFLYATDRLEVWHVYGLTALSALGTTFQIPAYSAAVTLLVPKRDLGRTSGLMQLGRGLAQLIAPLAGGVLMVTIGIERILLIDLATFLAALGTLFVVRFPKTPRSEEEPEEATFWRRVVFGWTYVRARSGLLGLLAFFAVMNFLSGFIFVLGTPVILAFSSVAALGALGSIAGLGMVAGTLVMGTWGGPRPRIYGVLGFEAVSGLCLILAGIKPSVVIFGIASFSFMFCLPIVFGSAQAIWQAKVHPGIQGRIFALRRVVAQGTQSLAFLVAGPLSDKVFEPLLLPGGPLAETVVGHVIGVGPARGIALFFVVLGLLTVLASTLGFLSQTLRRLEERIPDAIPDEPAESTTAVDEHVLG